MAKPIDKEFRDKLKMYMKAEWMKNGQQKFSKTVSEIAQDIFNGNDTDNNRNMVWRYLNMLERGGSIKIIKGKGSQSSEYIYVDDKFVKELSDVKFECADTIDDFIKEATAAIQKGVNINQSLTQKLIAVTGENNMLKQAILSLEPWGTTPDGMVMYRLKAGSELPALLDKLKNEINASKNKMSSL